MVRAAWPSETTWSRLSVHRTPSFNPEYSLPPFTGTTVLRPAFPSPSPRRNRLRYGNINPFSIDCDFHPGLRLRLTLPRLTLDRKPWSSGERAFNSFYRYLRQHSHLCYLHQASRLGFTGLHNAPLPLALARKSAASVSDLSPVTSSAQADSTSELLRFL